MPDRAMHAFSAPNKFNSNRNKTENYFIGAFIPILVF